MVTIAEIKDNLSGEYHYIGNHPCTRKIGPRGGVSENIVKARASGQLQLWKRSPLRFRLPVKHGLYESASIYANDQGYGNADSWHTADTCPLLRLATPRYIHGKPFSGSLDYLTCKECLASLTPDQAVMLPGLASPKWDDLAKVHAPGCTWIDSRAGLIVSVNA